MKKNIGILGCGWLGEPLATHLISKGFKVSGTTTSKEKIERLKNLGISSSLFSLENAENINEDILNSDIIIIAIPSKNTTAFQKLSVVLENSSIKNVIFISSTSVYPNSNSIITETSDVMDSPLVSIENLFRNNEQFKTTIIRFAGLFGYNRKPGNFFKNGRLIPNPDGFVNMIHRDDCIGLIEKVIEKNAWNQIFNGCADTHPSRREFYIKTAIDIGLEVPDFEEVDEIQRKVISNKKSKEYLDFKFKYGDLLTLNYAEI